MRSMRNIKREAQSLIEYGLILALVAVVSVTVLGKFGKTMSGVADQTNTAVSNSSANATCAYCNSLTVAAEKTTCKTAAGITASCP